MECDDSSWGRWLSECNIGDDATAAQDADPTLAMACECVESLGDIVAGADLEDMASKSVRTLPSDDMGDLGLFLEPGGRPRGLRPLLPSTISWPLPVWSLVSRSSLSLLLSSSGLLLLLPLQLVVVGFMSSCSLLVGPSGPKSPWSSSGFRW
ncbi:hypothetical protein NE237_005062 [Protea cynaroides]|uniref:Uncharacterized protein n=1 Tax=Protea cynaroides TaxID=273540 RepID=A0A9Q0KJW6_9MAGN|nr:hypothetical protein NE237_005062 [Protea cynaroides]